MGSLSWEKKEVDQKLLKKLEFNQIISVGPGDHRH